MKGLFPWIREVLFGVRQRCSAVRWYDANGRGQSDFKCKAKRDLRCDGGNCTSHCNLLCGERCKNNQPLTVKRALRGS